MPRILHLCTRYAQIQQGELINVKTSSYPVQLAGEVRSDDLIWQLDEDDNGLTGQAFRHDALVGFVTSGQHITRSMALIKQLAEN